MDPMAYTVDASQLLRVDVKQVAGRGVFVSPGRSLLFLESPDAAHALAHEVLRDRRDWPAELTSDLPGRLPTT